MFDPSAIAIPKREIDRYRSQLKLLRAIRDRAASIIQAIPASSLDNLMFDHTLAQAIWGTGWKEVLRELAVCPVPERDAVFERLYYQCYPEDAQSDEAC